MEQQIESVSYVASTTDATSGQIVPQVGFDIFSAITGLFSDSESAAGFFSSDGILSFLSSFWTFFAVLSYIITIILVVLYVFASVRKNLYLGLKTQELRDAEHLYDEQYRGAGKNSRLQDILKHSSSDNPNDWKLAIIEADIILDSTLKQRGYIGNSLGEKLKGIAPGQLSSLNDAWEAHKVRNRIAHDGADFVLTKRMVDETVTKYQRVFSELGVY